MWRVKKYRKGDKCKQVRRVGEGSGRPEVAERQWQRNTQWRMMNQLLLLRFLELPGIHLREEVAILWLLFLEPHETLVICCPSNYCYPLINPYLPEAMQGGLFVQLKNLTRSKLLIKVSSVQCSPTNC